MPKLNFVPQEKSTECGVACVAMLAGVGVAAARKAVGCSSYTDIDALRAGLRKLRGNCIRLCREVKIKGGNTKKQSPETRKKHWRGLIGRKATALVATGHREKETEVKFHWVLFNGNGSDEEFEILDPKVGRRFSTGKLRIAWYHLVDWV